MKLDFGECGRDRGVKGSLEGRDFAALFAWWPSARVRKAASDSQDPGFASGLASLQPCGRPGFASLLQVPRWSERGTGSVPPSTELMFAKRSYKVPGVL